MADPRCTCDFPAVGHALACPMYEKPPVPEIREFFVTFGMQYRANPKYADEVHPRGMHCQGYAVIEAPDQDLARQLAFVIFAEKWSFLYDTKPRVEHAPAGELLRFAWKVTTK